MLRTFIILAFVALSMLCAVADDVFTPREIQNHLRLYKKNKFNDPNIHPAYLISEIYANNPGHIIRQMFLTRNLPEQGKFIEQFIEKAKKTALRILTTGYGWGGFSTEKATVDEANHAFDAIKEIIRSTPDINTLQILPPNTDRADVNAHFTVINSLFGVAQKLRIKETAYSKHYNPFDIPEEDVFIFDIWAELTRKANSNALKGVPKPPQHLYTLIYNASRPPSPSKPGGVAAGLSAAAPK